MILGAEPNKEWAALPKDRPYSLSTGYNHFPKNPVVDTLVPTSQEKETPQVWRYTTQNPDSSSWFQPDFDDQKWSEGPASFGARDWRVHYARTRWNTEEISGCAAHLP